MNDKKILIWGTGRIASSVIEKGLKDRPFGFVETRKRTDSFHETVVFSADEIPRDYDMLIIANSFADSIYDLSCEIKLDLFKIVFLKKGEKTSFRDLPGLKEFLGDWNYTDYLVEYGQLKGSFFEEDLERYNSMGPRDNFKIKTEFLWPIIKDKYGTAGSIGNYFWQDLWAARKIIAAGPVEHVDIGSRIDGFIAHLLAAGIDVCMVDIRPFPSEVKGLSTVIDDATGLEQFEDNSIGSLSALCSLEHFGLGRYGDPIDPEACFKCFSSIKRCLAPDGNFYLSVPVGRERVEFNAHRVFFPKTIIDCFQELKLIEFSCTAEGILEENVSLDKYDKDSHNGEYRYGLFHFQKT